MTNLAQPDLTTDVALRGGGSVLVRPLRSNDVEALTRYFAGLSESTRSMYGPHKFDAETAQRLCAQVDQDTAIRFVALLHGTESPTIVGYMILDRTIWDADTKRYGDKLNDNSACLAPSIADAYQEQSLGTAMARHVLASAKKLGVHQVILMGGVVRENTRAVRLYERLGFRKMGEFWTHYGPDRLNDDMMIDLTGE